RDPRPGQAGVARRPRGGVPLAAVPAVRWHGPAATTRRADVGPNLDPPAADGSRATDGSARRCGHGRGSRRALASTRPGADGRAVRHARPGALRGAWGETRTRADVLLRQRRARRVPFAIAVGVRRRTVQAPGR